MGAVLRAIFGYCFLIFIVRIESRRPGKQMTPFEFVLIFFIGGLTLTTLVGNDRSLTNAICSHHSDRRDAPDSRLAEVRLSGVWTAT